MSTSSKNERQMIREALSGLANSATLRYYAPDVESWYSRAERALLEEIASASDRIDLRVHAGRWDGAREAEVGIRRTPAIALIGEKDYGIRYYGAPDGYELETFLEIIRAVADRRSGLSEQSRALLRELREPIHLEVLASPT